MSRSIVPLSLLEFPMKKLMTAVALALFGLFGLATAAHAADATCEAKAVDKNGKALAGAAKASFMKKCEAAASCESKAVDKNGKALAGAAKTSFMKKCESGN
jgi:hypothetical protein